MAPDFFSDFCTETSWEHGNLKYENDRLCVGSDHLQGWELGLSASNGKRQHMKLKNMRGDSGTMKGYENPVSLTLPTISGEYRYHSKYVVYMSTCW